MALQGILWAAVTFAVAGIGWPVSASAAECSGRSDEPIVKLLSPPPCETCEETKAELDELAGLEQARTKEQEKHVSQDLERSVARFLAGANIAFDAGELKKCEGFFLERRKEQKAAVDAAKNSFCRLRPFKTPGNRLHPVDGALPDDSFSYPSGHAAYGATLGFLLAEMLPEKRAAIYNRINDYAYGRMIAGVHFRRDVEAGKLIGAAVSLAYLGRRDKQAEYDAAQSCVRKAVGLSSVSGANAGAEPKSR
ncbi:MAG TPA: phosphatase PAP2 family protein [Hyphomicrobiales bacterium]|nr:phosphatase PAP2 family protein [Hyphomicrobiales bacterium]